jgi:hypothetical protein
MSIKLTDKQLVTLSAATQREHRCLVALAGAEGAAWRRKSRRSWLALVESRPRYSNLRATPSGIRLTPRATLHSGRAGPQRSSMVAMNATKILWGQVVLVNFVVLAFLWGTTEWVAWRLAFQSQLGRPWFEVFGWPLCQPPAFFWWWFAYDALSVVR